MLDSLISELPQLDQIVFEHMKTLGKEEKHLLWYLIKDADKNGIALYPSENKVVQSLMQKRFVSKNDWYEGTKISVHVLPYAPFLLQKLRNLANQIKNTT